MFVFQITLSLLLAACSNALSEPQCSRFEYDIQTLKAMLKVENKVENFEEKLQKWEEIIETRLDKFTQAQEKKMEEVRRLQAETENSTNAFRKEIEDMELKLGNSQQKFATQLHGDVMSMMSHMNSTMKAFVEQQQTLNKNRGQQVAFTVHGATGKVVNNVLTFRNVILNAGGGYAQTTGRFTCPLAGTYLFSATLLGTSTSKTQSYCWIRKNDTNIAFVFSHQGANDSGSVSVIFHLSAGDLVDLGDCYALNYIYTLDGYSSFIGSLIQAD